MRKIYKITNIALIFTLIGMFLCAEVAYSVPTIRVPSRNIELYKRLSTIINLLLQVDDEEPFSMQFIDELGGEIRISKGVFAPTHVTSKLAMRVLRKYMEEKNPLNVDFLDMGCGTGALSIRAAQIGANSITAIDNKPSAINETEFNVDKFGFSGKVKVLLSDLFKGLKSERKFDLVMFAPPAWRIMGNSLSLTERVDLINRFFDEMGAHLKDSGEAIIIWPIESWIGSKLIVSEKDLLQIAKKYGLHVSCVEKEANYGAYKISLTAGYMKRLARKDSEITPMNSDRAIGGNTRSAIKRSSI